MGMTQAMGMAEAVLDGSISLRRALEYHLQHNHYPPVPLAMVEPCIATIEAINEQDYRREITLPEGVSYRGSPTAPAYAIAENHHLDAFLDQDGAEDE